MLLVCERCCRQTDEADLSLTDFGDLKLCPTCVRVRAEELAGRHAAHREANVIPQPADSVAPETKEDS